MALRRILLKFAPAFAWHYRACKNPFNSFPIAEIVKQFMDFHLELLFYTMNQISQLCFQCNSNS